MFSKQLYRRRFQLIVVAVTLLATLVLTTGSRLYAADSRWEARYWNNKELDGDPVLVRHESEIDHEWGPGSPASEVNTSNFSARWRRDVHFSTGNYRFTATMDDGMRVWVDDVLIIDSWYDSQTHSLSADIYLYEGDHHLKVEYYEAGGGATAKLSWTAVSGGQTAVYNWRGEYYNNMSLSGTPALVRDDLQIDFNWGGGAPAWNVLRADQFSVRWTRTTNLMAGRYRFTTTTDDGVRLWVNGQLIIDQWHDQAATAHTAEIDLPGGAIPIQMDYYENNGGAVARLSWTRIGGSSGGTGGPAVLTWRGEYFNNTSLSGSPTVVRDDAQINFNWGSGSPVPGSINSDNFSVRWTRIVNLHPGRYRFTATTDDGVRLWVNGQLIIDRWTDHAAQAFTGDIDLPGGTVPIRMEYYDHTLSAQAHLSWTPVEAPSPSPGGQSSAPTATVTSYRLNVRQGPGLGYGIITTINMGQVVELAGYRNPAATWVKVVLPGGTQGWVYAGYLASSFPFANLAVAEETVAGNTGTIAAPRAMVTAYYLNVRYGPGVGYGIITTTTQNTAVDLLARNAAATWVKIRLPNGSQGWVNASYLTSSYPFANLTIGG